MQVRHLALLLPLACVPTHAAAQSAFRSLGAARVHFEHDGRARVLPGPDGGGELPPEDRAWWAAQRARIEAGPPELSAGFDPARFAVDARGRTWLLAGASLFLHDGAAWKRLELPDPEPELSAFFKTHPDAPREGQLALSPDGELVLARVPGTLGCWLARADSLELLRIDPTRGLETWWTGELVALDDALVAFPGPSFVPRERWQRASARGRIDEELWRALGSADASERRRARLELLAVEPPLRLELVREWERWTTSNPPMPPFDAPGRIAGHRIEGARALASAPGAAWFRAERVWSPGELEWPREAPGFVLRVDAEGGLHRASPAVAAFEPDAIDPRGRPWRWKQRRALQTSSRGLATLARRPGGERPAVRAVEGFDREGRVWFRLEEAPAELWVHDPAAEPATDEPFAFELQPFDTWSPGDEARALARVRELLFARDLSAARDIAAVFARDLQAQGSPRAAFWSPLAGTEPLDASDPARREQDLELAIAADLVGLETFAIEGYARHLASAKREFASNGSIACYMAHCAWRLGDREAVARHLALAEELSEERYRPRVSASRELAEQLLRRPEDVDLHVRFVRTFLERHAPPHGSALPFASAALEELLRRSPPPDAQQRRAILALLFAYAEQLGDEREAARRALDLAAAGGFATWETGPGTWRDEPLPAVPDAQGSAAPGSLGGWSLLRSIALRLEAAHRWRAALLAWQALLLDGEDFARALERHRAGEPPQDDRARFAHEAADHVSICHENLGELDLAIASQERALELYASLSWCGTCALGEAGEDRRRLERLRARK